MATGNLTRLESYPFDSNPPTTYDDYGRPVYDRAVGARMLRYTYEQFFSDGVFGTPADALQIGKAGTGLAVTIQPGMFIINGSIGAVVGEPITLQLSSSAPQGVVKYAIMLRYDNNQAYRSLYFRVVAGEAGGDVPAPETGTPEVKEYRLGYVTVPSGSTGMSGATVTNEKGTVVCPYSAPFEDIDLSEVVADAQNQANAALDQYLKYVKEYYDLVLSAVDGTTAGHLQEQIDELKSSGGIADAIDPNYLAYQDPDGDLVNKVGIVEEAVGKRELKDGAVTEAKLADLSVTTMKLSYSLQDKIGVLDPSTWDYDDYYAYVTSGLDDGAVNSFVSTYVTSTVLKSWSFTQADQFTSAVPAASKTTIVSRVDLNNITWAQIQQYASGSASSAKSAFVGKTKNATLSGYGTFSFLVVGVDHDDLTSGGKASLTFNCTTVVGDTGKASDYSLGTTQRYLLTPQHEFMNGIYESFDSELQSVIKSVKKYVNDPADGADTGHNNANYRHQVDLSVWPLSDVEYTGVNAEFNDTYNALGSRYAYYASNPNYHVSPDVSYWTRKQSRKDNDGWICFMHNYNSGSFRPMNGSSNLSYRPAFCI